MMVLNALGRIVALVLVPFSIHLSEAQAQSLPPPDRPATGWIDLANDTVIAGWAKDPDFDAPIAVHIYVDGILVTTVIADKTRSDVGQHAFHWKHQGFGPGRHKVMAWAVGITAGNTPARVHPLYPGPGEPIAFVGTPRPIVDTVVDPPTETISIPPIVEFAAPTAPRVAKRPRPAPVEPTLTLSH